MEKDMLFSVGELESGLMARGLVDVCSGYLSEVGPKDSIKRSIGKLGSHLVQVFQWPAYTIDCCILAVTLPIFEGAEYLVSIPLLLSMAIVNIPLPIYAIEWMYLGPLGSQDKETKKGYEIMLAIRTFASKWFLYLSCAGALYYHAKPPTKLNTFFEDWLKNAIEKHTK